MPGVMAAFFPSRAPPQWESRKARKESKVGSFSYLFVWVKKNKQDVCTHTFTNCKIYLRPLFPASFSLLWHLNNPNICLLLHKICASRYQHTNLRKKKTREKCFTAFPWKHNNTRHLWKEEAATILCLLVPPPGYVGLSDLALWMWKH